MVVSGHQPVYLPFIGLFHKIAVSDVFMFVDQVQLEKKSWQTRNQIRTKDGWLWLSVPVVTSGRFTQTIAETKIDDSLPWRRKHWRTICLNYGKASYFSRYSDFFEELYRQEWSSLAELNKAIIRYILGELQIKTRLVEQSDFHLQSHKTQLLIDICRAVGADTYLSNEGSRAYVDERLFNAQGLKHRWQVFNHPVYPQLHVPFVPYMSVVDLLFNVGPGSLEVVMSGGPHR